MREDLEGVVWKKRGGGAGRIDAELRHGSSTRRRRAHRSLSAPDSDTVNVGLRPGKVDQVTRGSRFPRKVPCCDHMFEEHGHIPVHRPTQTPITCCHAPQLNVITQHFGLRICLIFVPDTGLRRGRVSRGGLTKQGSGPSNLLLTATSSPFTLLGQSNEKPR